MKVAEKNSESEFNMFNLANVNKFQFRNLSSQKSFFDPRKHFSCHQSDASWKKILMLGGIHLNR